MVYYLSTRDKGQAHPTHLGQKGYEQTRLLWDTFSKGIKESPHKNTFLFLKRSLRLVYMVHFLPKFHNISIISHRTKSLLRSSKIIRMKSGRQKEEK